MEFPEKKLNELLDKFVIQDFQEYAELNSLDESVLLNAVITGFLKAQQQEMDQLINGYVEMSDLNEQIVQDFLESDSETYWKNNN